MADALGTPPAAATPTVGVVSAIDHRLALAGLIAPQTSSLAVRTGVLVAPGSNALITGTSATGTMTVNIAPHHWVTTRGTADGIYLGTKETSTTVNIAAAPGANSRIDVIYVRQKDSSSTITPDGSTGEEYGVVTGTAAASPTKPAFTVAHTGAVEIGTVTVAVGATNTLGAGVTIANTAALVVARGADVPVHTQAERDALTTFPLLAVKRLDTGAIEMRNAANSAWVTVFDPAVPSPGALPRGRVGSSSATTVGGTGITTETMIDTVTFTAVAGRRYKVTYDGVWISETALVTAAFDLRTASGSSVTTSGTLRHGRIVRASAFGEFLPISLVGEITGLSAGTTTVGLSVGRVFGSGTIQMPGTTDNRRNLIVEDTGV